MASDCQITLKLDRKMISFFLLIFEYYFWSFNTQKQDIIQEQRTYDLDLLIQPGTVQTMAGKLQ